MVIGADSPPWLSVLGHDDVIHLSDPAQDRYGVWVEIALRYLCHAANCTAHVLRRVAGLASLYTAEVGG